MALKVVAGMRAWFLSGPLYMPICTLGCITPITVNVDWLICRVLPTASLVPKRSLASSSPRKITRRFSARSRSFRKRPPGCGSWLRISPKSGSTPQMRALTVFVPTVRPRRRWYSGLTRAISGMRARSRAESSSRKLMGRPEGRPA